MRKQLISIVLAMILLLASAMPVFADTESGEPTGSDPVTTAASDDITAVYEAYCEVTKALASGNRAELDVAIACFEKVLDIVNDMDDKDATALAGLMGITSDDPNMTDGEYAMAVVLGDWIEINILDIIDDAYTAYIAKPNAETAKELVEIYEQIFTENEDNVVVSNEKVYAFFPDIDKAYADAKAVLSAAQDTAQETTPVAADAADGSPQTGDESNVQIPLAIMLLSAVSALAALKRRRA